MPQRNVVLFDLDDTLVDHQHSMRAALGHLRETVAGLDALTVAEMEAAYSAALHRYQPLILAGELPLPEARIQRMVAVYEVAGLQPTPAEAAATTDLYHRTYRASEQLVEGAFELLTALRDGGFRLGVITNHTTLEQQAKIERHDLAQFFEVVIISEAVRVRKPDPAIFQLALAPLNATPSDAVMVGDTWHADIVGAHNVGMAAIWINRYGQTIPDPSMATEVNALYPIEDVLAIIAG